MSVRSIAVSALLIVLTQSQNLTALANNPSVPFPDRIDTLFTIMEETFDASDYSETFRTSFFNFQTGYAANNCNYAERMAVLKQKEALLDELVSNIYVIGEPELEAYMQNYKSLDFELTFLRNIDLISEAISTDSPEFEKPETRQKLYIYMVGQFKEVYPETINGRFITIENKIKTLIEKYKANLNVYQKDSEGKTVLTGVYTQCENRFSRLYSDWVTTFKKFEKSNTASVALLGKAVKRLVKSITSFDENVSTNFQKILKEESEFFNKNTQKGDGFFANAYNLAVGSAEAVGGDFVKVYKAFAKEYQKYKTNFSINTPENFKQYVLSKTPVNQSRSAFQQALGSGLNLQEIAYTVESLKQQEQTRVDDATQIKKLQMLTDVHSAYTLQVQSETKLSSQYTTNTLNSLVGDSTKRPIDKLFESVYNNQCNN